MVLPASMDATWLNPASVQYNAQELRRADATMFEGDGAALGVTGGVVRHGDLSLAVTVSAGDVVTVQPGAVVVPGNSGVGNGCYRTALGSAETGNLVARNATNARIDLVIFRVLDTDVVGTHGSYTGRIEVLDGVPSGSPVAPALPVLAVELARITVPNSAGGAATVDNSFRTYAAGLGGRLAVATLARLPTADAKWGTAVALDTGLTYTWNGVAWIADDSGWIAAALQSGITAAGGGFTVPGYRRIGSHVFLRGIALSAQAQAVGKVLFVLPAGFRPADGSELCYGLLNGVTIARIDVNTAGSATCQVAIPAGNSLSVSGINF